MLTPAAITHILESPEVRQYGTVPLDGFVAGVLRFRDEGGRGCNVTVPFKFEAASLPGVALTERAQQAGAANTLRFDGDRIFADNTDGIGLVNDITRNAGVPLAGARILLVDAGGARTLVARRPLRLRMHDVSSIALTCARGAGR